MGDNIKGECIYQRVWYRTLDVPDNLCYSDTFNKAKPDISDYRIARIDDYGKAADETKLLYGVMYSLRNIVKKLSGSEDHFTSFQTSN